jgi:hypothetical protein
MQLLLTANAVTWLSVSVSAGLHRGALIYINRLASRIRDRVAVADGWSSYSASFT